MQKVYCKIYIYHLIDICCKVLNQEYENLSFKLHSLYTQKQKEVENFFHFKVPVSGVAAEEPDLEKFRKLLFINEGWEMREGDYMMCLKYKTKEKSLLIIVYHKTHTTHTHTQKKNTGKTRGYYKDDKQLRY